MSPTREPITIRLRDEGVAVLDQLAAETRTDRSKVVRALVGAALASPMTMRAARAMLEKGVL